MKLFALLLLLGSIGMSCQDRYIWPAPPIVLANKTPFKALYYANGLPAGFDLMENENEAAQSVARIASPPQPGRFLLAKFTATKSVTSTVTSTVTSATVVRCVPSSQFATTTACARRRRDLIGQILETPAVRPDKPIALETTAVFGDSPVAIEPQPDIVSSKSDKEDEQQQKLLTSYTTVTTLVTSYTFIPTTITSTVSLGISTGLLCLPASYTIC